MFLSRVATPTDIYPHSSLAPSRLHARELFVYGVKSDTSVTPLGPNSNPGQLEMLVNFLKAFVGNKFDSPGKRFKLLPWTVGIEYYRAVSC